MKRMWTVVLSLILLGCFADLVRGKEPLPPEDHSARGEAWQAGGLELVDLYRAETRSGGLRLESPRVDSPGALSTPVLGGWAAAAVLGQGDDEDDDVKNYVALKAGPVFFLGDVDDLDVGFDVEVAFGWQPMRLFALEFYSGYMRGEDESGSTESVLWAVPFGARAQVLLPLLPFLRIYGGLGAGGYYINSEVDVGALDDEDDDAVFGGEASVGVRFRLTRLLVGAELKYFLTTEADLFTETINLEGVAALAWAGIRF